MALPLPPNNPNQPIPNNPFYYPETSSLQGDFGQLVVGSGLSVNYSTGVISSTGGGGGGAVNQVTGGSGIFVSPTTGNVVVNNTGVLELTAGTGISITGSKSNYTITSLKNGTVTSVTAGTGLTGGIITSTGTLAVDGTVVLLRSLYTAKGQILASTAASNVAPLSSSGFPNGYVLTIDSTAPTGLKWDALPSAVQSVNASAPVQSTGGLNPVISVSTATTSNSGVTTLVDDVLTNDSTKALTAAQGYALQQQINGLTTSGGLTLAGTLDASTGLLTSVTASGSGQGFTAGSALPAAAAGNTDYFVIVTTPGTYTPPGGSAVTATQGDWFNSTGTAWDFLNVGFDAPAATTTVAGIVCLSTDALAQGGTDTTTALTPAAATSAFIQLCSLTAKGSLVTATALGTPSSLGVGGDGTILTACAAAPNGLCWASAGAAGIPCACVTGKGAIISGTAANNPVALSAGTDGQVLIACAGCSVGLTWGTLSLPFIPCAAITAKGDLITGPSAGTPTALNVGTDGQILSANSSAGNGLCWCTPDYIPCSAITAKGDLIVGTAACTPIALAVGTQGCVLEAYPSCPEGVRWSQGIAATTACGRVYGCTKVDNTILGYGSALLASDSGIGVTMVGACVQPLTFGGRHDTFIGYGAVSANCYCCGRCNTAVGGYSMRALGANAWGNVALGADTQCDTGSVLTGCYNVLIGAGASVSDPAGHNQLVIQACNPFVPAMTTWLTGCCDGTIRPAKGIRDCAGNTGFAQSSGIFQVLASEGDAGVVWSNLPRATLVSPGVLIGCQTVSGLALGTNAGALSFGVSCAACSQYSIMLGWATGYLAEDTRESVVVGSCSANVPTNSVFTKNVIVGTCALRNANLANPLSCTVIVGWGAGCYITGVSNTIIGATAGTANIISGTNNTALGFGSSPASGASNTVTLGNASITTLRAAVTSITSLSDARDKDNIRALPLGIQFLRDVEPVQFIWKQREGNPVKDGTEEAGFIAQQLKEAQDKHSAQFLKLVDETDPNRLEASPGKLLPVMVKAIQELAEAHEKLRQDFDEYRSTHP